MVQGANRRGEYARADRSVRDGERSLQRRVHLPTRREGRGHGDEADAGPGQSPRQDRLRA